MLQVRSMIAIADNTGAKKVMLIGIFQKGNSRKASIGDIVVGSVKEAVPYSQVKKGEIVYAVLVRTRKEKKRKDGSYIRFDDNACVILQAKTSKEPKGTRIFGPVAKEIKDLGFNRIASLAEEIY